MNTERNSDEPFEILKTIGLIVLALMIVVGSAFLVGSLVIVAVK